MSDQKLNEILEVCDRYIAGNSDFYSLFNVDKSSSLEEIQRSLRKARVMFHPDQANYIPVQYQETFDKILNEIPNFDNIFSNPTNRDKYDSDIANKKNQNSNTETEYQYEDLEPYLRNAIITQANKYGWNTVVSCIKDVVVNSNFLRFTRDDNARGNIEGIGPDRIRDIILNSSIKDVNSNSNLTFEDAIMNYITDIFSKTPELNEKLTVLENSCIVTGNKYGQSQMQFALLKYLNSGDPSAFTNTNNARFNLVNSIEKPLIDRAHRTHTNVERSDVSFMMRVALNRRRFENPNYSYTATNNLPLEQLTSMYAEHVQSNYGQDVNGFRR